MRFALKEQCKSKIKKKQTNKQTYDMTSELGDVDEDENSFSE